MSSGQARKRKYSSQSNSADHTSPDHKLFIQAHEADLIHAGPEATQAARALELPSETSTIGDGLIKWTSNDGADDENDMWVDRYDNILNKTISLEITTHNGLLLNQLERMRT
jgi:hypothetical protein